MRGFLTLVLSVVILLSTYTIMFNTNFRRMSGILVYRVQVVRDTMKLLSPISPSSPLSTLKHFQFVIDSDVCGEDPVELLVLFGSRPNNTILRNVLREVWRAPPYGNYTIRSVFLFGIPDDPSEREGLVRESETYGDIVQGNFRDAYHNVTFRDLMGLRWTWTRCPQARFVMHVDDDIVVDMDEVMNTLRQRFDASAKMENVICYIRYVNAPVWRDGRYAVSREEYINNTYPPYCNGWVYWFTPSAAKALDKASLQVKPYWMNDVYITGDLVKHLDWNHEVIAISNTMSKIEVSNMLNGTINSTPKYAIGPTEGDEELVRAIQERFRKYALNRYIYRGTNKQKP